MPKNTLSLLEINPAFIEAFLVGLNHEMSRELRWREYPAALGQTWFQHFFDTVDPAERSIPLDRLLGGDPRSAMSTAAAGDRARRPDQGRPDPQVPRRPRLRRAGHDRRSRRAGAGRGRRPEFPSFVGTLQRGVNFYGFDTLTEEEARGDGEDNDGWFFVLEEEPRAMRFGLDRGKDDQKGDLPARGTTWPGRTWPRRTASSRGSARSTRPTRFADEDLGTGLDWGDDAAVMAAITFRRPIQVYMHASAMLPRR